MQPHSPAKLAILINFTKPSRTMPEDCRGTAKGLLPECRRMPKYVLFNTFFLKGCKAEFDVSAKNM